MHGGVDARVDGSGGLRVASVAGGNVALALDGSGDLGVHGGEADMLSAQNGGSGHGDVQRPRRQFAGSLAGSGDINIGARTTSSSWLITARARSISVTKPNSDPTKTPRRAPGVSISKLQNQKPMALLTPEISVYWRRYDRRSRSVPAPKL